jgi:CheY-like chemotaxis protein
MDVQMADMDGLEATAAIRKREALTGDHTPIFAMTARAMKGDREAFLNAGMDGNLIKPVEDGSLVRLLRGLSPLAGRDEVSAPVGPAAGSPTAGLDGAAALERVGGNLALFRELVEVFIADSEPLLSEIAEAIRRQDASRLERAAHTLKGMLRFFDAPAATDAAARLEELGHEGLLAGTGAIQASLVRELGGVRAALELTLEGASR